MDTDTATGAADRVREEAAEQAAGYRQGEPRPLGGYVTVVAVFAALVTGAVGLLAARRRPLPDGFATRDLVLLVVGTHKLSRTLTKDAVLSPLRAPFTQYESTGGPAEVMEDVRAAGSVRHAVGELVTCPFCLDVWIATGFALGLIFAPRATRIVLGTFSAVAGADFLQLGYAAAQQAG
ncbi:Protein of unknown function [Pseudonocardia ammonioxydans]|uniref:DUF1360 domain-containing protein n=1 Tax=Pseudonocardia ammonioxydans TaxID=260086 RepID=A0A1I5HL17_PSUAM|nr:DUF1360 domain-containing protein [Pseudonocardia ammonioxydans]SFO48839.1 Protein of unknown function [Pseudonocardia ammonioxydans]